jgi:Protein of unknown function (DUF1453)
MSSSTITTTLLILAVAVYMIARQFMKRPIRGKSLLIIPALIAYYTYTNVVSELTQPLVDTTVLVVLMLVGLALGGGIGLLRGRLAHVWFDARTNTIYAKASTINIFIWLVTLVLKVATGMMLYFNMNHSSVADAALIAIGTTLFLGSVLAEAAILYLRAAQLQTPTSSYPFTSRFS